MSNAAINPATVAHGDHAHDDGFHATDPNLAHHFDTPDQQYQSSKLGMWVFLGTEILMFGGLFCAYSVYRHNHPEVFEYAHQALDKTLGAVNTIVLITSSLTMAWGVRAAQMGKQALTVGLLALTILGGFGFMAIKSVEYRAKWEHQLWIGSANQYNVNFKGVRHAGLHGGSNEGGGGVEPEHQDTVPIVQPAQPGVHSGAEVRPELGQAPSAGHVTHPASAPAAIAVDAGGAVDPNAGTDDAAKIRPNFATPPGLSPTYVNPESAKHEEMSYEELGAHDQARVSTFFSIYFVMTGLHGIHVIVGMSLIFWIMMRAGGTMTRAWSPGIGVGSIGLFFIFVGVMVHVRSVTITGVLFCILGLIWTATRVPKAAHAKQQKGEFGPTFFTPVDLVGLYWHIVDIIWIFLFPLLYLIT